MRSQCLALLSIAALLPLASPSLDEDAAVRCVEGRLASLPSASSSSFLCVPVGSSVVAARDASGAYEGLLCGSVGVDNATAAAAAASRRTACWAASRLLV